MKPFTGVSLHSRPLCSVVIAISTRLAQTSVSLISFDNNNAELATNLIHTYVWEYLYTFTSKCMANPFSYSFVTLSLSPFQLIFSLETRQTNLIRSAKWFVESKNELNIKSRLFKMGLPKRLFGISFTLIGLCRDIYMTSIFFGILSKLIKVTIRAYVKSPKE